MAESFQSKIARWKFNFFPAYRNTGARLTYISSDFLEMKVRLPLEAKTRNYVATMFGGSMYAAVDPIYMMMLIHLLGPEYIVWDKAAAVKFKKPGRTALAADFKLTAAEVDEIKQLLTIHHSVDRIYNVEMKDESGAVCAEFEKTLYIRRRDHGLASGVAQK